MSDETKPQTFPTIHLNGTSKEELYSQVCEAMGALRIAIRAHDAAFPNARDYYPQGDTVILRAVREHDDRSLRLQSVLADLGSIAEHIADSGA